MKWFYAIVERSKPEWGFWKGETVACAKHLSGDGTVTFIVGKVKDGKFYEITVEQAQEFLKAKRVNGKVVYCKKQRYINETFHKGNLTKTF